MLLLLSLNMFTSHLNISAEWRQCEEFDINYWCKQTHRNGAMIINYTHTPLILGDNILTTATKEDCTHTTRRNTKLSIEPPLLLSFGLYPHYKLSALHRVRNLTTLGHSCMQKVLVSCVLRSTECIQTFQMHCISLFNSSFYVAIDLLT